jgi:lipopolysaccharide/colanic/teichoic acid biosynthesis glycosyltransferase
MGAGMKMILWVLGALAAAAIAEEILGWVTPMCRRVLRRGARRLPGEWRARYAEEWEAELLALPGGPVTKLAWTIRTRVGVRALNAALARSRQPRVPLLKEVLDRAGAVAMLVGIAPMVLLLAAAVKLTSRGPTLFRQERVGRAGESFQMLKLRSMYVDADQRLVGLPAEESAGRLDPRVTPLGRFMRRYSLDELPQLLNVLRGDMSLVGPRPPLPREVLLYADDDSRLMLVKPGLTGLWQISRRSDLTWEESMRVDLRYVDNWSLALDLLILWQTAWAVFGFFGSDDVSDDDPDCT